MPSPRTSRLTWLALSLAASLAAGTLDSLTRSHAQDRPAPKSDGALDDLLKELKKSPEKATADAPKKSEETPKPAPEPNKPADNAEKPASPEPRRNEVTGKDKALDSLLEKLGTVEDEPTPEPRRGTPPPDGDEPEKDKVPAPKDASKAEVNQPRGADKDLDEHLEELTGRRRKKKQDREGEDGGPLSEVVKEMRDVEQRLGKVDTGEETRQKQRQIVKNLETLIEQMRSSEGQPQTKQRQVAMQKGQQPGRQPGQEPGANARGAPLSKPQRPTGQRVLAGGKDEWGHLPPELRQELENVFKEEPLPAREELVRRYYLSVSKKRLNRGE